MSIESTYTNQLVRNILFFIIGLLLITAPELTLLIINNYITYILMMLGILKLVAISNHSNETIIKYHLSKASIDIVIGLSIFFLDGFSEVIIAYLLGLWMLLQAIVEMIEGYMHTTISVDQKLLKLLLGLTLFIGGLLTISIPFVANIKFVMGVGFYLLVYGVTHLLFNQVYLDK